MMMSRAVDAAAVQTFFLIVIPNAESVGVLDAEAGSKSILREADAE